MANLYEGLDLVAADAQVVDFDCAVRIAVPMPEGEFDAIACDDKRARIEAVLVLRVEVTGIQARLTIPNVHWHVRPLRLHDHDREGHFPD
jgi:hypothetical protein